MSNLDFDVGGFPPETVTARRAGVAAQDANPDSAAKAFELAPKVGLPPSIVQYDVDGFASRAQQDQNNALIDAHPKLAEFVSDPAKAAAVKDDYEPLAQLSAALDPGGWQGTAEAPHPAEALTSGVTSGYEHQSYGRLAYRLMKGDSSVDPLLRQYEAGFAGERDYSGFDRLIHNLGGLVGGLGSSVAASWPEAAGGAVVGSVAPGVGTATGLAAGTVAGVVRDAFISTAGQTYRALDQVRDKGGQSLPEPTRKVTALVAGGLNASILAAAGPAAKAVAGGAVGEAVSQALQMPGVAGAIAKGLVGTTAAGLEGGVLNLAMELSQSGTQELAKTFSGQDFNTAFNDPVTKQEIVNRLGQSFVDGAALFGTLHALPVGVNYLRDRTAVHQTAMDAEQRLSILNAVQVSKTAQRAPELLREYIVSHDYPDIQISVEAVAENRQHFSYLPDLDAQIERQLPLGGDITIPAADYFTRTPPEVVGKLNERVRGVSGLTPEEAQGLHENPPEYAKQDKYNLRLDSSTETASGAKRHSYTITKNDEDLGYFGVDLDKDNSAKIQYFGTVAGKTEGGGPNSLGPTALRNTLDRFQELHPDVTTISGTRISGARQGPIVDKERVNTKAEITPKSRIQTTLETQIAETTENTVATQRRAMWLDPILDPGAAGLAKLDFARYSRAIQEVQRDITKKAYDIAEREIRRRETPLWRAGLAKEAEATRADLSTRPDIEAYRFLTTPDETGTFRLNRNDVDGLLNRESPADYAEFQKGNRASKSLPDKMFSADGVHPDEAADYLGFSSGADMLRQLREYEANVRASGKGERAHFEALVVDEARRRMEEKNGKLQENIMREAVEEALSVKQVDVLIEELKGLGANEKITRERVQALASEKFADLGAKSIKSSEFERRVGKFGQEAERALLAGKPQDAFQAKQKQLINFVMAREARAFERERARTQTIVDRFSSNGAVNGVDQSFTDQMHNLLRNLDLPIPRSDENLERALGRTTFRDFVNQTREQHGWEVEDTPWLHDFTPPRFQDLSVGQFRQIANTFESMNELGRRVNQVIVAGKTAAYEDAVRALVEPLDARERERIAKGNEIDLEPQTLWAKRKEDFRALDAMAIRMEQLALWNDARDPLGPWNTYVYRVIKEAQHDKSDHLTKFGKAWSELPVTKEWQKSLDDLVPHEQFFDEENRLIKITRKKFMGIVLNSGNDGNMRQLAHSLNARPEEVRQFIADHITDDERALANGIWGQLKTLWPDIEEMVKRTKGIAPERIKAAPHNGLDGGYFPLMREPRDVEVSPTAVVDRAYFNPVTDSSASKERTGALYKLDLTLDRLPYAIRATIHDIHFREPVAQVAKLLADPIIRKQMDKAWGPEYTDQMLPWIKYIANDGGMPDPSGLSAASEWSRWFRQNMVTSLVGGRISTAVIHGTSALGNSVSEVGMLPFLKSTVHMMSQNPWAEHSAWRQAFEQSGEIRNRMHNMYLDINNQIPTMLGEKNFERQSYQAFATKLISYLDQASAVVVYNAKLEKGLNDGLSMADAIYAADQSVRVAHGASGIADLPAVSRGGEASKWFTSFYGYFNHNFNRLRDTGKLIKEGDYWQAVSRSLGYLLVPALIHEALRGGNKVNQSWLGWGAEALISQFGGGFPMIREAVYAALHGHGSATGGPIGEVIGGPIKPIVDLQHAITGKPVSKDWLSHSLATPGWLFGHMPYVSGIPYVGKPISLLSTKSGSGVGQFIWDKSFGHMTSDTDYKRLIFDGIYHPRKQEH